MKERERFSRRERESTPQGCIVTKMRERERWLDREGDLAKGRKRNAPLGCIAIKRRERER